jgi:hypothetical protein
MKKSKRKAKRDKKEFGQINLGSETTDSSQSTVHTIEGSWETGTAGSSSDDQGNWKSAVDPTTGKTFFSDGSRSTWTPHKVSKRN